MRTYQALNQNEIRAVELTLRDNDGMPFDPEEVATEVTDMNGDVIIPEQSALFTDNVAYTMIGTVVTGTTGEYKLKLKIIKSSQTYFHVTKLTITGL